MTTAETILKRRTAWFESSEMVTVEDDRDLVEVMFCTGFETCAAYMRMSEPHTLYIAYGCTTSVDESELLAAAYNMTRALKESRIYKQASQIHHLCHGCEASRSVARQMCAVHEGKTSDLIM